MEFYTSLRQFKQTYEKKLMYNLMLYTRLTGSYEYIHKKNGEIVTVTIK